MNRPSDRNVTLTASACGIVAASALDREYVHVASFAIGAAYALRWALGQCEIDPYAEIEALYKREEAQRAKRTR